MLPELAGDLARYKVASPEPLRATIGGRTVLTTPGPSRGGAIVAAALERLTVAENLADRAEALRHGYASAPPLTVAGTTHISVIDADGNAAAFSSTLGSGSGIFRGGTQLNNMLGELDVVGEGTQLPGARLASMMTPTLVLDDGRPRLALGSAGSVRLAGAIAQVADAVLRGIPVAEAIERPRIHVDGDDLHLEGGLTEPASGRLECRSLGRPQSVLRWRRRGRTVRGRHTRGRRRPPPRRARNRRRVTLLIRAAKPDDAATLAALAAAVGREPEGWLLNTDGWRSVADERRYLRALRRHPDAAVFVAEEDGEIVGRLSVARDPHQASRHVADLGLMVADGHRRRGIGRALLEQAVAWARKAGVRKLELHVFPWNEPAIHLYEQFGFEREGLRKDHYRRGGEYVDAILMALRLTNDAG